ncbi:NAD(P)-binding protein [Polyplosphaeria fusca]|uniref:NAD(P)-binding protein n=1 Tax=Polyplosphaeria fusca TaxID=682080 RepID=A0A9P4QX63_9PLEO|nr:NAD(P)-binding protein [Polyplosphaeria fusca]
MTSFQGKVIAITCGASRIGLESAKLLAQATVQTCMNVFGREYWVDLISGRKGIGIKAADELEDDDWDFVLGVNLTGLMYCQRAELRALKHGGSIVNAASVAGLQGRRSRAHEKRGQRYGGTVETPMVAHAKQITGGGNTAIRLDNSESALGRVGQPSEVTNLVTFLLSDEASFITGAIMSIDGSWHC